MKQNMAIAIHGGAGTILREKFSEESEAEHKNVLKSSLSRGYDVLSKNGSAVDAVQAAVIVLEDSPLFNAGRGSVFTHEGSHEMDAAIMDGQNLKAGSIAGVCGPKNPVSLARVVMDKTDQVLYIGKSAENLAQRFGLETMPIDYFFNGERFNQLQLALKASKVELDHTENKFGTVGAVALDLNGNLAAATSTGGMTNKPNGRVGDSPIIGAGTYADNESCAVSCTGHGEYFIRSVVAFRISCMMTMLGKSVEESANFVVKDLLVKLGGEGGLIALDKRGQISMPFNSRGMYRGLMRSETDFKIMMFEDE